jgi:hypothetical protein
VRLLPRILVVALVYLVTPSLTEAAENVWHLLSTGHDAHAVEAGSDHAPQGDEHGCSGTYHLCGCCHTAPVDSSPAPIPRASEPPDRRARSAVSTSLPSPFLGNPEHPPRT